MRAIPYLVLVLLVAATSYYQQRRSRPAKTSQVANPQQQMLLKIMPVFFAVISLTFPAGLIVYFLTVEPLPDRAERLHHPPVLPGRNTPRPRRRGPQRRPSRSTAQAGTRRSAERAAGGKGADRQAGAANRPAPERQARRPAGRQPKATRAAKATPGSPDHASPGTEEEASRPAEQERRRTPPTMEWVETTARTIEEAKDLALDRLGVDEDEAEFEILEEPRAGLFGRVRVRHGCGRG